jgi:hypothetical protein
MQGQLKTSPVRIRGFEMTSHTNKSLLKDAVKSVLHIRSAQATFQWLGPNHCMNVINILQLPNFLELNL